ncbi:MAG: hypothetical protein ABI597_07000 [Gammaproteobacteria bacterium]
MELKNKSPYVAATTKGLIDNSNQNDGTNDNQTNQGPKHVTYYLFRSTEVITKSISPENMYD